MADKIIYPQRLSDALEQMDRQKTVLFAGGTDFMVKHKRHGGLPLKTAQPVLFISQLPELSGINVSEDHVTIGSVVTFADIIRHKNLPPALIASALEIASVGIRNIATIGGNICNASPAADILPALYCLNAELKLTSVHGDRVISIEDFITGPGQTVLNDNELLTEIRFQKTDFDVEIFRKIGTRKANALAKISFCGMAKRNGEELVDIRLALGAVAPVVVRKKSIEQRILHKTRSQIESEIALIADDYAPSIRPIDDQRSTATYRKRVTLNLMNDFLRNGMWK